MRKRIFLVSLVVVLIASISLWGCTKQVVPSTETAAESKEELEETTAEATETTAEVSEKKLIGVLMPHPESPFVINLVEAVRIEGRKQGWTVIAQTPAKVTDVEQFNILIEDMTEAGVNALIMQSMDIGSAATYAKKAMEAGVWTIHTNWDQPSPIEGAFLTVMGVKNHDGAKAVAVELAKMVPPDAKAVYIGGSPGWHDTQRETGFEDGLKEVSPNIEVLGKTNTMWTRETAFTAMNDMLQRFPKIDLVYGASDEIALGAIEALKAAGRLEGTVVGGYDANPNAIQSILAGELTATVSIAPLEMAIESIKDLKLAFEGKANEVQPLINMPTIVVTKENAEEFLKTYKDFGIPVE
jgi:ABC-type sugar transport system substrate-binding protein